MPTIYVDRGIDWVPTKEWPYGKVHHMYCASPEALHKFAIEQLGLKRSWCSDHTQPNARLLHYDLSPGKFKEALAKGAKLDGHGMRRNQILSKKKRGPKQGSKNKSRMDRKLK